MDINYSDIRLIDQKLISSHFKLNEGVKINEDGFFLKIENNATIKTNLEKKHAKIDLELSLIDEENDEIILPFSVSMKIEGVFAWEQNYEENEVNAFLETTGVSILYSYFRPIVTQNVIFAGYPPLFLPIIDFSKSQKNNSQ
jgi:preprotein translocase subunit SecB